jgi:hypothetical protein
MSGYMGAVHRFFDAMLHNYAGPLSTREELEAAFHAIWAEVKPPRGARSFAPGDRLYETTADVLWERVNAHAARRKSA